MKASNPTDSDKEALTDSDKEALRASRAYLAAGFSMIPIALDGSKDPLFRLLPQYPSGDKFVGKWKEFQDRFPTEEELSHWFDGRAPAGVGVLMGRQSGNAECIDFDARSDMIYPAWCELVATHRPGVRELLTVHKSPNGIHVVYRCPGLALPGPDKLAMRVAVKPDKPTLIETRAEGSYIVAPGSPPKCDKEGKRWVHLTGPRLSKILSITPEDRQVLLAAARTFDEMPVKAHRPAAGSRLTAIDDYLQRGPPIPELLPEGWQLVKMVGQVAHYRRPDKDKGSASATLGFTRDKFGGPMFYPFTSACEPFAYRKFSDKFQVYADAKHGGDKKKAASAIYAAGYGDRMGKNPTKKEDKEKAPKLLDVLLPLDFQLFLTSKEECYLAMISNGKSLMWEIGDQKFMDWAADQYFRVTRQGCTEAALNEACRIFRCMTRESKVVQDVHMRCARHEGRVYIDLATKEGDCIEIDAQGWRILPQAPIRFFRNSSTFALPRPVAGGALDDFRAQLNLDGEMSWLLLAAFMGYCWFGIGDYPVLLMTGESGSSKSTTTELVKDVVDPNNAAGMAVPEKEEDYLHNAKVGLLFWLDNISSINQMQSDAFCRLSTGGAFLKRMLYSNNDVCTTRISRPIAITTITEVVTSDDLLQRCIEVRCKPFGAVKRLIKARVKERFASVLPQILGALANAVSAAMRHLPTVPDEDLPRLADFSVFGEAFWRGQGHPEGEFMAFMEESRRAANALAIENSPLAEILIPWFMENGEYSGCAANLWKEMQALAPDSVRNQRGWPKSPSALSRALDRLAPNLRRAGIVVMKGLDAGSNASRFLSLTKRQ